MLRRALVLCLMATTPAVAEDVTTFRLENGMDVVVIEDNRAPVVTHPPSSPIWSGIARGPQTNLRASLASRISLNT